jgi:RNA-directed DNA polymerase
VGDLLTPSNMSPWPEVRDRLNAVLRGWSNYFSRGDRYIAYRAVDHYVYGSVRHFMKRRHKVSSPGTARFSDNIVFGKLGVLRLSDVYWASRP